MIRLRPVVCAVVLLASQVATTGVAPVVLGRAGLSAGLENADECQCGHEPGAVCPMHRKAPKPDDSATARTTRWCNGCADPSDAIVSNGLVGPAGLPEGRHQLVLPAGVEAALPLDAARAVDRDRPPVSPPPRS